MCKWNDSAYKTFIDGDRDRIITGNLNIVSDLHLRKLVSYGTNLDCHLSFKQIMQQFTCDLDLFIYKFSIHYNKRINFFKLNGSNFESN